MADERGRRAVNYGRDFCFYFARPCQPVNLEYLVDKILLHPGARGAEPFAISAKGNRDVLLRNLGSFREDVSSFFFFGNFEPYRGRKRFIEETLAQNKAGICQSVEDATSEIDVHI